MKLLKKATDGVLSEEDAESDVKSDVEIEEK